jgi:hypothetical protein
MPREFAQPHNSLVERPKKPVATITRDTRVRPAKASGGVHHRRMPEMS